MKKPKVKIKWIVNVSYSAGKYFDDFDIDSEISKFAKRFNGVNEGSGLGFGRRDVSLCFRTEKNAQKFKQMFNKSAVKSEHKIRVDSINYYESAV